jgi:hypothetical protein
MAITIAGVTYRDRNTNNWPDASNTGVPAGTTLTAYSGPMTITTNDTIIDSKNITGALRIEASGVIIRKCYIFGGIYNDEVVSGRSFTAEDCEINVGGVHGENAIGGTGIASRNYTALRCHIYGGRRSINAWIGAWVQDCYVHGQAEDPSGVEHESGIRMGAGATILHNTIICDAPDFPPDAGCSAAMTGYGDYAVVENNLIQNNYFGATTGGYCAYGGSTLGKPFSAGANNIRFIDNVFQKGPRLNDQGNPDCGYYGAITAFDINAPGNVWSNNRYSDGTVLNP